MQIWIDGDACPKAVKEILFRAADRARVTMTLVANSRVYVPTSPFLLTVQVAAGPDVADALIAERCDAGDLVVTADIPLAALVVRKGAFALNPRGQLYDAGNIGEVLARRDFMDSLRGSGIETGGPAALHPRDIQDFANQLDRFLTRHARK